jgi:Na+-transporting NADH:ubiquinone oxidoreductase subunit C
MDGFLSLEADLDTVSSLVFYAHGETPGMGARIGDLDWQAAWRGKRARDETGQLRIGVRARPSGEESPYEIDAMSGATRTGQGVTNLLRFWLGDLGYAPMIRNLKSGAPCVHQPD